MNNLDVKQQITTLANSYKANLSNQIYKRKNEMKSDNLDHYVLYNALGISDSQGFDIDLYQNIGRFLYKYAGAFLEDAAKICFVDKFGVDNAKKVYVPNIVDSSPKKFEIDCLVNNHLGIELKWRDATTDGDHKNKEHKRVKSVSAAGYKPIRVMFYKPNRTQSIKIQTGIRAIYESLGGEYYAGADAFNYVKEITGIDLLEIITSIKY